MAKELDDMTPEEIVAWLEGIPIDPDDIEWGYCQKCGAPATHSAAYVQAYDDGEGGNFCRDFGCDEHRVTSQIEIINRHGAPPSVIGPLVAELERMLDKRKDTP
jgi:hypothetical protein